MGYKKMTVFYAIIQLFFGVLTSSLIGFITVYLNEMGIKSIHIGIFISLCNLFVVFFNYINEKLAKLFEQKSIVDIAIIFCFISIISLLIEIFQVNKILTLVFLFFPYLYSISIQTTINSISGYMYNKNIKINFGLAKVFCSISFSINTIILSKLIDLTSVKSIIIFSLFSYLLMIGIFKILPKELFEKDANYRNSSIENKKNINIKFYIFLLGYGLLCAYHFMKTTYMIDIIEYNSGNINDLGNILSIGSISEIPLLFLFTKIENKFKSRKLLKISSVFFLVQSLLILFSTSIKSIYIASFLQGLAFGLLIPSGVYYINENFDIGLNEKAQSLLINSSAIGTICSTSFAGLIISYFSFDKFLWSGTTFCLVGLIIFVITLPKEKATKSIYF